MHCVNLFNLCNIVCSIVAEEEQRSLGWSYYKVFEPTKSSPYNKEVIRYYSLINIRSIYA